MMKIYIKHIRTGNNSIVTACDSDLLGKTLKFGNINIKISKEFYQGSLVNVREAINIIKKACNINLIGPIIVNAALREKLVHPQAILYISGTPHTQIIRL